MPAAEEAVQHGPVEGEVPELLLVVLEERVLARQEPQLSMVRVKRRRTGRIELLVPRPFCMKDKEFQREFRSRIWVALQQAVVQVERPMEPAAQAVLPVAVELPAVLRLQAAEEVATDDHREPKHQAHSAHR